MAIARQDDNETAVMTRGVSAALREASPSNEKAADIVLVDSLQVAGN